MAKKLVVSLDALLAEHAGYLSYQGTEYPVLPIAAPEVEIVERIDSDDPPKFSELLVVAKRLCPTLPESLWAEKAADVLVGQILGVSQRPVRMVEADLPNSSGPVTEILSPAVESHAP